MAETKIISGVPAPGQPAIAPGTQKLIDSLWGSDRQSPRPWDYTIGGKVLGFYRHSAVSGLTTGLAAGNLLYSFRYADPSSVAVLLRVTVNGVATTAFTTAQPIDADGIFVRGWTTSDTAGTALTSQAQSTNAMRTKPMGNSLLFSSGDLRIATAAAVAAGATKTPDANPFGFWSSFSTIVGGPADLYKYDPNGGHPPVFAVNEGFNLRLITAQGAVGVVKYYVAVEWAELAGF